MARTHARAPPLRFSCDPEGAVLSAGCLGKRAIARTRSIRSRASATAADPVKGRVDRRIRSTCPSRTVTRNQRTRSRLCPVLRSISCAALAGRTHAAPGGQPPERAANLLPRSLRLPLRAGRLSLPHDIDWSTSERGPRGRAVLAQKEVCRRRPGSGGVDHGHFNRQASVTPIGISGPASIPTRRRPRRKASQHRRGAATPHPRRIELTAWLIESFSRHRPIESLSRSEGILRSDSTAEAQWPSLRAEGLSRDVGS